MWPDFLSTPERAFPARPSLTLFFCLVGAYLLTLLPHVSLQHPGPQRLA